MALIIINHAGLVAVVLLPVRPCETCRDLVSSSFRTVTRNRTDSQSTLMIILRENTRILIRVLTIHRLHVHRVHAKFSCFIIPSLPDLLYN